MRTDTPLIWISGCIFFFFLVWIGITEITGGSYTLPLILFGICTVFIVRAFYRTKHRRRAEDTPTSSIATGAVGSEVEIHGNILVDKATSFTAPLSGKPCGAYLLHARFRAEVVTLKIHRKEKDTWESIRKIDRIYVDDGSGSLALVDLQGIKILKGPNQGPYDGTGGGKKTTAEINLGNGKIFLGENPAFRNLLKKNQEIARMFNDLDHPEWKHGVGSISMTEWALSEGTSVYVRGYAQSALKKRWKPRLSFKNFMKAKKAIEGDEALASRFDTNRDGKLDPDELEEGAKTLGLQYESETGPDTQRRRLQDKVKMVFQHSRAHPLTVFAGGYNAESVMLENLDENSYEDLWSGFFFCIIALWIYWIATNLVK